MVMLTDALIYTWVNRGSLHQQVYQRCVPGQDTTDYSQGCIRNEDYLSAVYEYHKNASPLRWPYDGVVLAAA